MFILLSLSLSLSIYIYIDAYTYRYTRTYVCIYMYIYMCIYVYACMCVYIYRYIHTYRQVEILLTAGTWFGFSDLTACCQGGAWCVSFCSRDSGVGQLYFCVSLCYLLLCRARWESAAVRVGISGPKDWPEDCKVTTTTAPRSAITPPVSVRTNQTTSCDVSSATICNCCCLRTADCCGSHVPAPTSWQGLLAGV